MKFIKPILAGFAASFFLIQPSFAEIECKYEITGTDSIVGEKQVRSFETDTETAEGCLVLSIMRLKTPIQEKSRQRGPFSYVKSIHPQQVRIEIPYDGDYDFPAQKLRTWIEKDKCLSLKQDFTFYNGTFSDYFVSIIDRNPICK